MRRIARHMLESYGFQILEARNGLHALEVSKEYAGPIHVLITDTVMPQMGGSELAEATAAGPTRHQGPVHFRLHRRCRRAPRRDDVQRLFLQKPFTPQALANKVNEVLYSGRKGR